LVVKVRHHQNYSVSLANNVFIWTFIQKAYKEVIPPLRSEGFFTLSDVKWEDVRGGPNLMKEEFKRHIVDRIKYPEECKVVLFLNCNYIFG